uniref:Mitochondrial transcription termination factor family protein n=1 Tax=Brassica campestris TaxID=3711 RepID=M4F069_BRACM
MRWHKAVGRYYDFVKDIIEADKSSNYEMSCLSLPHGTCQGNIIRNVLALRRLGVPQKLLFSLLTSNFHVVSGKERFEDSLEKIVAMGFDPANSKFVKALFSRRIHCLQSSFEAFIGLGFSGDEFVTMVKHCPQCIGLSAESVKKKIEFLVKEMNWSLKAVVSNPAVFGYNLEKRTVPRCNVIKALMTKGLLGSELPPLSPVLVVTGEAFLNKYVIKHDDDKDLVAALMAISPEIVLHRSSYTFL